MTPNHYASDAIGQCIRSQFRGPYHHYDAMTKEDKLKWWSDFKVILNFNYNFIQINQNGKTETKYFLLFNKVESLGHLRMCDKLKMSESKVKKRFCVMLTKAKEKSVRPTLIGEQACVELLNYWDTQNFKDKSTQNKVNRASACGGALHSTY